MKIVLRDWSLRDVGSILVFGDDSEDSAQIQAKFLYFKLRLLVSTFIPGEGRDDLHLVLYPFCQILSFDIYFV